MDIQKEFTHAVVTPPNLHPSSGLNAASPALSLNPGVCCASPICDPLRSFIASVARPPSSALPLPLPSVSEAGREDLERPSRETRSMVVDVEARCLGIWAGAGVRREGVTECYLLTFALLRGR